MSNEELAVQIQQGNWDASALLIKQNWPLLQKWAAAIQAIYDADVLEDMLQEGAIALLEAARHFDPAQGVKLMSYAGHAIQQAMREYAVSVSSALSVPNQRLQVVRYAAHLAAEAPPNLTAAQIEELVSQQMKVSPEAARRLLAQGRELLSHDQIWDIEMPSEYGDPEGIFWKELLSTHLELLVGEALSPREQTVVRYYFGLGDGCGGGMTLEKLAVFLNYNRPSGAQKVLDKAIKKLRDNFDSGEYGKWSAARWLVEWQKRHLEPRKGKRKNVESCLHFHYNIE